MAKLLREAVKATSVQLSKVS